MWGVPGLLNWCSHVNQTSISRQDLVALVYDERRDDLILAWVDLHYVLILDMEGLVDKLADYVTGVVAVSEDAKQM